MEMVSLMFIFKTKHIQELLNNEHTVANVVDDLTIFDIDCDIYDDTRKAYAVVNNGLGSTEVYDFEPTDKQDVLLGGLIWKESYSFYDVACPYCEKRVYGDGHMLGIYCAECFWETDAFDNFSQMQELLKSGKIIKMRPRWRWVK